MKLVRGDYVLATKYSDGLPLDSWAIGIYDREEDGRHYVINGGEQFRASGFRRCERISNKRGAFIIDFSRAIGITGKSLWWWKRCSMEKINKIRRLNKK